MSLKILNYQVGDRTFLGLFIGYLLALALFGFSTTLLLFIGGAAALGVFRLLELPILARRARAMQEEANREERRYIERWMPPELQPERQIILLEVPSLMARARRAIEEKWPAALDQAEGDHTRAAVPRRWVLGARRDLAYQQRGIWRFMNGQLAKSMQTWVNDQLDGARHRIAALAARGQAGNQRNPTVENVGRELGALFAVTQGLEADLGTINFKNPEDAQRFHLRLKRLQVSLDFVEKQLNQLGL